MIQDIANKHNLVLSRVAGEKSDLTPERVAALLSRRAEHASILEMLAHFGIVTDFSSVDVNRPNAAQEIAQIFNLAVAEHGRDRCIALTDEVTDGSFVLCWTKLPVKTKAEFIKAAVAKLSAQQTHFEMLVDALDNIDD
jgi:hypothetical protein